VINPYNRDAGCFLPKVSIQTPTIGDRKSSMDADRAERTERILTACSCGEEDEDMEDPLPKWRRREGSGENATIEVDATMRKEV